MDRHLARLLSRSLAGYLCGTHSGALRHRRGDRLDPGDIAAAHRSGEAAPAAASEELGAARWTPEDDVKALADRLRGVLDHESVVDLICFGSQARGSTTGFSDIDAVLVVADAAAESPDALRRLRGTVMAAQRAVLEHQPMQHHGFEVATPRLLRPADAALAMPRQALERTRSLFGRGAPATFGDPSAPDARGHLHELAGRLSGLDDWPSHPWRLHGAIAMFELLPALHLQARGEWVPKARSYEAARQDFGDDFWPYDVLRDVRDAWPRRPLRGLAAAMTATRNPWVAVAAFERLPVHAVPEVRERLDADCLRALQGLANRMQSEAA